MECLKSDDQDLKFNSLEGLIKMSAEDSLEHVQLSRCQWNILRLVLLQMY
jgi:hypothetical protein